MSIQGVIKGFSSTLKGLVLQTRSFGAFRIGKFVSPQIFGSNFQSSLLVSVHLLVPAGDCPEEKNRRFSRRVVDEHSGVRVPGSVSVELRRKTPMCGESGA